MKKCVLTILLSLLAFFNLSAAEKSPFQWSAVVKEIKSGRWKVRVLCQIAEKSYLYAGATRVSVTLADGKTADIKLPPGVPDKSGEAVYRPGAISFVMFAKAEPVRVTADFQGCISGGGESDICLMPESKVLWGEFAPGTGDNTPKGGFLSGSLMKFSSVKTLSGLVNAAGLKAFITADNTSNAAAAPAVDTGFWGLLLLVVLGGLGLNLTPCVLPMIPINLSIIGANPAQAGKWRGLRRGAAYGLGITLTYGALGVLAAVTGRSFGELNSSSIFNAAVAVIFVVLALGMFGIFNIDLARISNLFPKKTSGGKWSLPPEISAFGLGIVAALLAGACVAPVVISVVVLSGKLYSEGNFWALALPFALGLSMALPWPLLGAGLSVLPKPGAWMVRVKYIFGIIILLMAAYYGYTAWNLRSGAFNQQQEVARVAAELDKAAAENKNVLLDCHASWCKNCAALDKVIASAEIQDVLKKSNTKLIKFRTEKLTDPVIKAFMQQYKLPGLPSLLLLKK